MSLRRNVLACLIASGCLLTGATGNLWAYEHMKFPNAVATKEGGLSNESLKSLVAAVKTAVKEPGSLSATDRDALKTYAEYLMVEMTRPTKTHASDKRRTELLNLLLSTKSEDGRVTVRKAVAGRAVAIIDGDYYPQAKINAMLMLAEPTFSAEAISPLYKFATNPKTLPHLRSLALSGVGHYVRAAGAKMPKAQSGAIANAMATIISSQPQFVAEEKAHWWMVRRAYDVLSVLHATKVASTDKVPVADKLPPADKVPPAGNVEMKPFIDLALTQFMDPSTLPSVRISAGLYLTHYDLSAADEATRTKVMVSVAQLLDQEVVGWYEQEQDKTQSASSMGGGYGGMAGMGGMGGYGDMGMESGTGSGEGYGSGMGGYGSAMGGYGSETGGAGAPKPIDTQKWDLRLARRKLNTYCQLAHVLLMGTGASDEDRFSRSGKGIMETELPEQLRIPGKRLLQALEAVQTQINERSLTDVTSLMTRVVKPLEEMRIAAEDVPGLETPDGAVVVASFNELSPRKKSLKKADAKTTLEAPKTPEQMAAEQAGAAGGEQPNGEQPAAGQEGDAAQSGAPGANPPAGNQQRPANPPAGNQGQPANQPPQGNPPAGANPAGANPAAGR